MNPDHTSPLCFLRFILKIAFHLHVGFIFNFSDQYLIMHFYLLICVVCMMCCDCERNYLMILVNLHILSFPEYEEVTFAILYV
jgi:hypothetical protein